MKRKIFIIPLIILCLFLCAAASHAEDTPSISRLSCRFMNHTEYRNTILSITVLRSDGTVVNAEGYLLTLTIYETALGEDSATDIFIGAPISAGAIRVDTVKYGFLPKIDTEYTVSLQMWNQKTGELTVTPKATVRPTFAPKIEKEGMPTKVAEVSLVGDGFYNTTDSENLGFDSAVTTLAISVTVDGKPFLSQSHDFYLYLTNGSESMTLKRRVTTPSEDGIYTFEPYYLTSYQYDWSTKLKKGQTYSMRLVIQDPIPYQTLYYSDTTLEVPCNVEPVLPNYGLAPEMVVRILPAGTGIRNLTVNGIERTVMQFSLQRPNGIVVSNDIPPYYYWKLTVGEIEKELHPLLIDRVTGVVTFDLSAAGILPEKGRDYTVDVNINTQTGELFYASYPMSGFVAEEDPIPLADHYKVTPTPAERTFLETGMLCFYLDKYTADPDVSWDLTLTCPEDANKTVTMQLLPSEITKSGLIVFELPQDLFRLPFTEWDALTLKVSATDEMGITYESEESDGFFYDLYPKKEPAVQNPAQSAPEKKIKIPRSLLIVGCVCAVALAFTSLFAYIGRKK